MTVTDQLIGRVSDDFLLADDELDEGLILFQDDRGSRFRRGMKTPERESEKSAGFSLNVIHGSQATSNQLNQIG